MIKPEELTKDFYSVKEAMEILGVNRDTIYRYLGNGKLESIKLGGHKISRESLANLITPKSSK